MNLLEQFFPSTSEEKSETELEKISGELQTEEQEANEETNHNKDESSDNSIDIDDILDKSEDENQEKESEKEENKDEQDIEKYKLTILELQRQIDNLNKQIKDEREESIKRTNALIEERTKTLTAELDQKQNKIKDLESSIDSMTVNYQKDVLDLKKNIQDIESKHKEEIFKLQNQQNDSVSLQAEDLKNEIINIRRDLALLSSSSRALYDEQIEEFSYQKKKFSTVIAENRDLKFRNSQLEHQLDFAQKENTEYNIRLSNLTEEKEKCDNTIRNLQQELLVIRNSFREDDSANASSIIESQRSTILSLTSQLETQKNTIYDLKSEIDQITQNNSELSTKLLQMESALSLSKNSNEKLEQSNDNLKQELTKMKQQKDQKEQEYNKLKIDNDFLTQQNKHLINKRNKAKQNVRSKSYIKEDDESSEILPNSLSSDDDSNSSIIREENANGSFIIQNYNDRDRQENEKLLAKIADLTISLNAANDDIFMLKTQLQEAQQRLEQSEREKLQILEQKGINQSMLKNFSKHFITDDEPSFSQDTSKRVINQQSIDEYEEKLHEKEQEITKLEQQIKDLKANEKQSKRKTESLEHEVSSLKKTIDSLSTGKINKLTQEKKKLESDLNDVRKKYIDQREQIVLFSTKLVSLKQFCLILNTTFSSFVKATKNELNDTKQETERKFKFTLKQEIGKVKEHSIDGDDDKSSTTPEILEFNIAQENNNNQLEIQRINEEKEKLKQLKREIQQKQTQNDSQIQDLKDQNRQLILENTKLNTDLTEQKGKVTKLLEAMRRSQQELVEANKANELLTKQQEEKDKDNQENTQNLILQLNESKQIIRSLQEKQTKIPPQNELHPDLEKIIAEKQNLINQNESLKEELEKISKSNTSLQEEIDKKKQKIKELTQYAEETKAKLQDSLQIIEAIEKENPDLVSLRMRIKFFENQADVHQANERRLQRKISKQKEKIALLQQREQEQKQALNEAEDLYLKLQQEKELSDKQYAEILSKNEDHDNPEAKFTESFIEEYRKQSLEREKEILSLKNQLEEQKSNNEEIQRLYLEMKNNYINIEKENKILRKQGKAEQKKKRSTSSEKLDNESYELSLSNSTDIQEFLEEQRKQDVMKRKQKKSSKSKKEKSHLTSQSLLDSADDEFRRKALRIIGKLWLEQANQGKH